MFVLIFIGVIIILFAAPIVFMSIWNFAVVAAISVANPIDSYWVAFWLMLFLGSFTASARSSK